MKELCQWSLTALLLLFEWNVTVNLFCCGFFTAAQAAKLSDPWQVRVERVKRIVTHIYFTVCLKQFEHRNACFYTSGSLPTPMRIVINIYFTVCSKQFEHRKPVSRPQAPSLYRRELSHTFTLLFVWNSLNTKMPVSIHQAPSLHIWEL